MRITGYLLLITLCSFIQAAESATLTATSFDGPGCNLIEAVTATENDTAGTGPCAGSVTGVFGDDTILLTSSQPYVASNLLAAPDLSLPVIRDNLTVIGDGAIKTITRDASAPNLRLFLLVSGARLTLKNIKVSNFKVRDDTFSQGAVVRGQGDLIVTLEDTVFEGNSADIAGGAINLFGSASDQVAKLSVDRSAFVENSAFSSPAVPRVTLGAAIEIQNYFELVVRNSTFSDNEADGCGAIAWNGVSNYVELVNNTFSGNTAKTLAGAICGTSRDGNGRAWIANNIIAGNISTGTARSDVYFSYSLLDDVVVVNNNLLGDATSNVINGYNSLFPIVDSVDGNILGYSDAATPLALKEIIQPLAERQGIPFYPLPSTSPAVDTGTIGTYIPGDVFSFWHAGCRGTSRTLIPSFDFNPDQLKQTRPVGAACDIGAIEYRDESSCYVVKTNGQKVVAFCL